MNHEPEKRGLFVVCAVCKMRQHRSGKWPRECPGPRDPHATPVLGVYDKSFDGRYKGQTKPGG